MGLISDELNSQLNNVLGKCFAINRMADRGMSLLMVRWKLINMSKILHPKIAHSILGDEFADSISEYQGMRSNESIYPATPIGDKEYNNPLEFFNDYLGELLSLENLIKDVAEQSVEEGDITTKVFLDGLISRLTPYIDLAQNLVDITGNFGTDKFNLQMFDSVFEHYISD